MIRVLIVDDQDLIRESLEIMLNTREDIRVVGKASEGEEALVLFRELKPDVILMDIRMPGLDGIECIRCIKDESIETSIIVLTTFDDDEYVFRSIKNGASGYLLKSLSSSELADAIRTVHAGGGFINSDITTKVLKFFSDMARTQNTENNHSQILSTLQNNEKRIIDLIGRGMSNKEISRIMNLSDGTVRNYISSVLQKLDLRDRTQIAIFAIQNGMTLPYEV